MEQLSFFSPSRAAARLVVYVTLTLVLLPVQAAALLLHLPLRRSLPRWYHRQCARILGFRIERYGEPSQKHPTLFVSNHASYLDVAILGALLPASFVAKSEVSNWPFFGTLARLQRTVFIERVPRKAVAHRDEMTRRLEASDDLILFPEGTSDDGNRVLPFKSALFSVAEKRPHGEALTIQPVSIAYTKLDGMPMGRYLRPFFAWYGDMELASHMWTAVGLGTVTVEVTFHPSVSIDDFPSRKALAQHCQETVAQSVSESLTGRHSIPPAARPRRLPGRRKKTQEEEDAESEAA